jgi:hypothetical protein
MNKDNLIRKKKAADKKECRTEKNEHFIFTFYQYDVKDDKKH